MAPVITKDRPDSRFFINIMQSDDGNWSSEPMPLDDVTVNLFGRDISTAGLRSRTQGEVNNFAQQFILNMAPDWYQRDLLFILHSQTSGPEVDDANAVFNWINAVRNYSNILNDQISVMTFDQIVVFTVPAANWPSPPDSLQGYAGTAPMMAPLSVEPAGAHVPTIEPGGGEISPMAAPMAATEYVPGSGEAAARRGRRHRPRGAGY